MSEPIDLQAIKDQLKEGASIFIVFGGNVTVDHVGAALALFLTFKKAGFDALVASPSEMRAEFTYLVGLDKVGRTIGNRNLVISFKDYQPGSVDKVSHNDDVGDKFELTIQPKSGHKAPDPSKIDYYFTGAQADLIFIIGTARFEDLGSLYESETNLFHDTPTVIINKHQNTAYGSINIVDSNASSLCELTAEVLENLGYPAEGDIASNLLSGIDFATNRFQNPVISADAFTVAGKLLASGGKRPPQRISSTTIPGQNPLFTQNFASTPFARALASQRPTFPGTTPTPNPPTQPIITLPTVDQNIPPSATQTPASAEAGAPEDWTQPKIYQGGTRV